MDIKFDKINFINEITNGHTEAYVKAKNNPKAFLQIFTLQIIWFSDYCKKYNITIVEMNQLITQNSAWEYFDFIEADNTFLENGEHKGVTPEAYKSISKRLGMEKIKHKDYLVKSNSCLNKQYNKT